MQWRDTIVLMGIPIDNLTIEEAVEKIAHLAMLYRRDGKPRHVATVNVDFMVNTLSWSPTGVRHPELLHILRQADMVTADGMPLVWLSRLLGSPLRQRVAGADLVPLLAKASAERGLSLYFLGGRGDVAERAAEVLAAKFPGVRIVGIDAPFVHTQGTELADFEAQDQPVLEKINAANPDILLIGFGNPKQEIWFDRHRSRIRAGVSIGIGGTFEFITGRVSRAPVWMQKTGLEWIYRMLQEPRRLLKRYFVGLFKFSFLALPSIVYILFARAWIRRRHAPPAAPAQSGAAVDTGSAAACTPVRMPEVVDAAFVSAQGAAQRERMLHQPLIALDLSGVGFIDSSGLGFLLNLMRGADEAGKKMFFICMTPAARHVFEVTKTWDLIKPRVCKDMQELQLKLGSREKEVFSWSATTDAACAVVKFSGNLDAYQAGRVCLEDIIQAAGSRHTIVNLAGLDFCDSSGIALFLKLHRALASAGSVCILCSPTRTVQQMLRITKLDRLIICVDTLAAAREIALKADSGTAKQ